MPEGHLLHRIARERTADLAGAAVTASSPQGRPDVAPLSGAQVRAAEAHGKHLLVHRDDAPSVRVHLGMRGGRTSYACPVEQPAG